MNERPNVEVPNLEVDMTMSQQRQAAGAADTMSIDEALALSIAAGDTDAWDRFFDRYSSWVYRFAYHHLNGNHADAEDLCSDIIITASKSISKFDPERGNLDAWLHGLARNRLSRFCRSRKIELPLIPDIVDQSSTPETTTCNLAEKTHVKDVVNRALAYLPERQAAALVAKYVEGYTTDELAQSIGSSTKAVESLLVRARTAFRTAFSSLVADGLGGKNDE